MAVHMEDNIYNELRLSYQNKIHNYYKSDSLQYLCFKIWVKNSKLTKTLVRSMIVPPIIKRIIENYSEFLICDFCEQITWDFDHRILHIKRNHMEEIYSIVSRLEEKKSPKTNKINLQNN